jgi:hypothetical protein
MQSQNHVNVKMHFRTFLTISVLASLTAQALTALRIFPAIALRAQPDGFLMAASAMKNAPPAPAATAGFAQA